MRKATAITIILLLTFHYSNAQSRSSNRMLEEGHILENFENDEIGTLPHKWYNQKGEQSVTEFSEEEREKYKYEVVKGRGGNKYLKYSGRRAMHLSLPLINKDRENIYGINIFETPILSWKVRAYKLPENAREDDDSYNDSVASIYVAFDMGRVALVKKVPKTIRYTWSSTLEKGTELSKFFGNQKVVVVESGDERTGKWITFKRNIVEDYRRLFGDDPPKNPIAILILSDGDSTHSWAEADYDDIKLLPEQTK
ncbi:DUF3047 domain-containing protein [Aliifodinibius salicampi]|uniref:DUF3047 domain-containing protein n=1 Tax=Fodinibius salicampi TaxID=1920655 RepID=A0ABT3PUZ3_9BACT|nr:DUF3047 domain-containing protein [Fodinibius salicampi]MCW9711646.1 DUF3047 domain-containing protein [Fodinibius salicampi]